LGFNIAEVIGGAALVAVGTGTEIGTAGLSTPISAPAIALGFTSFYFGTVGAFESYQHIKGSLENDRYLMDYDYFESEFGSLGKDYGFARSTVNAIKGTRWLRRPVTNLAREGIPWLIAVLRYEEKYGDKDKE